MGREMVAWVVIYRLGCVTSLLVLQLCWNLPQIPFYPKNPEGSAVLDALGQYRTGDDVSWDKSQEQALPKYWSNTC
jgi:hypothetical protein